jgi:DegV family protein with EDD domain
MPRVRIVTDSTTRFTTSNLLDRFPITFLPIGIRSGSFTVQDSPTSDLAAVQKLIEKRYSLPTPIGPTQEKIAEIYADLQSETDQVLSIHTSSGLINTVAMAHAASQQFRGRMDIQVIDSYSASVGLGILVQAAVEAALRGEKLEGMVRIVRGMIPRLYLVFFLDNLDYLEKNGLVSRSQAILGNMLGIIPFLTIEEGQLIPMEKVRSRARAIEKLIEFVCEFAAVEHLAIMQSDLQPSQESLSIMDRLRSYYPSTPISTTCYGPFISTFVGQNSLGVAVLEAEEGSL